MKESKNNGIALRGGIVPTMLVAYREDGSIDFDALAGLIDWYIRGGVDGIFTLCHSTESHWLTLDEKKAVARFTVREAAGRVPVIASGVTSPSIDRQLYEAETIAECGADAVVFIRNRLGNDRDAFCSNIEKIVDEMEAGLPLGLYECPYPYKRYLSFEELDYVFSTGRFRFIKDTICSVPVMKRRKEERDRLDPAFQLYNANCATLLESLRFGYDGFCGIMANFHPDLYSWLYRNQNDPRADVLDKYLGVMSLIEMRAYPICAKRYLKKYENIMMTELCRSVGDTTVQALDSELDGIHGLTEICRGLIRD